MKIYNTLALMVSVFALQLAPAYAAQIKNFDAEEFNRAKSQGKAIILAFHQEGCSTCAAQEPKLESALKDQDSNRLEAFRVEFDRSSSLAKQYGVVKQSTLVVLKGESLKAKETGLTDETKIRGLIAKGI